MFIGGVGLLPWSTWRLSWRNA